MAKFLANENMPSAVVKAVRQVGHDLTWIAESSPGINDDVMLASALAEGRVLLTFDKATGSYDMRQAR